MKAVVRIGLLAVLCLALLPAQAALAAPPAPKGKLVYEDDFSDKAKSKLEDNLKATDFSRGFHAPGVYHLIMRQPNETHWKLFPDQSYNNFSFQLEIVENSDDFSGNVSAGVVFRATDDTHMYAVLIDARKQQFAARKLDGQKWSDLIAFKASPLIKARDGENILRVDGDGDTFTIYLNGQTLDSFKDAAYKQGGLGMIQSNIDAVGPHSHFDNVVIYSTDEQPANQPVSLPKTGGDQGAAVLLFGVLALLLLGFGARIRRAAR